MASNKLTGTIVTEIGNLSNLVELWLEDNQLTGSLPDTLGNLGELGALLAAAYRRLIRIRPLPLT